MASLNGFAGNVSGTTGSTNTLEPKQNWRVYVLPRGIHASAASTGTLITVDSANAASRVAANQWVQVGTDTSKIVQVSAVSGNSFSVGSAVVVAQNDRILVIGSTQPSVTGGSASYQPNTTIYPRDDDASTPTANSVVTTSSDGLYEFWAGDALYDLLVQDSNRANAGILADVQVGNQPTTDFTPVTSGAVSLGSCALPFNNVYISGEWVSGITSAAGRTYHDFRTCHGVTQGNLFAFGISNQAPKVYGDTHGGVYQSYTLPRVFNVKSSRFGALGDNSTDDTTAINNAITAAAASESGATGAIVYFPKGTYIVNSQIVVSNRVRLVGEGRRNSIIKAGGSFTFNGTTDSVIRIGDGSTDTFGALVEHIDIDCAGIANSIGVYSTKCQEGSGLRDCIINNFAVKGIFYDTSGCQNWTIERVELFKASGNSTAIGVDIADSASSNVIYDITVNGLNSTNSTNPAIRIAGANVSIIRVHVERYDEGIRYNTNATGTVRHFTGHSSVVTMLIINQSGVLAEDLNQNSSTNLIGDAVDGITFNQNSGGWYYRSNDGSVRSVFSSSPDVLSRLNGPTTFGASLTAIGTFTGSSAAILTCGTVTTLPAGNLFGISSAPAGATTVTSITPLTNGRRITLIGQAGTVTFANGTGLKTGGPAVAAGECIELVCWGTTWHQVAAKL